MQQSLSDTARITLVPYVSINGQRTLKDDFIKSAFDKTRLQSLDTIVFSRGAVQNRDEFFDFLNEEGNLPVFIFLGDDCVGYAWLNGIVDNYAFGHFCFFREIWGIYTDQVGVELLNYWASFKDSDGRLLDVIIGIISKRNKNAVKFIERIGFTILGEIPKIMHIDDSKESAILGYRVL